LSRSEGGRQTDSSNASARERKEDEMTYEIQWAQPNPLDLQEPTEPAVPDTETLLAEVGAGYPAVSYPAQQEIEEPEELVDQTILAGLVWP
jgi:hypothetical protein